jgi:general secretion pathway protein A
LSESPFGLESEPKFLYHSTSREDAAQQLLNAIEQGDGFVVLFGEMGVGKTTLCRTMIEELDSRTLTAYVTQAFETLDELLRAVLIQFSVTSHTDLARTRLTAATGEELMSLLSGFIASLPRLQTSALVFVDDAQEVPADVLEQMGDLIDASAGPCLLQFVLVGEPILLKPLNRRKLRRLKQRTAARVELQPLAADEVDGYIMHRVMVAGSSARVEFDDAAVAAIFQLTAGVPRSINLLCDQALTLGREVSASVIDKALVRDAAASLDLAPPAARRGPMFRLALAALIFALLMGLGAGAAAWLLRDQVAEAIGRWTGIPPPPAAPAVRPPPPLDPIPPFEPPEDGGSQ